MSKSLRSPWDTSGRFSTTCLLIAEDPAVLTEMLGKIFTEFPKEHYNTRVISQGSLWEVDSPTALEVPEFKDASSIIVSRTREKLP